MEPPRRYSASPLHSFVTVPTHRAQPFNVTLRSIIAWLTGRQPQVSKSEKQLEARLVDLLAAEIEENEPPAEASLIDKPRIMPRRPRRIEDPRPAP
jgi:hypothetical protein